MMRPRQWLACAAVGLGLLSPTQPCFAQGAESDNADEPDNATELGYRDGAMQLINGVLDRLAEAMSPDELALLRETEIRMPMDYDITRVDAFRDGGRVIEISYGFYGQMASLCQDWVVANYYSDRNPNILNVYDEYLSYVDDTIDRNDRSIEREHIRSFAEFGGIPPEAVEEILSDKDASYYVGVLEYVAIAFVLAHELGHHVLGHVDSLPVSPDDSRARETAADRYAFDLTMRSGFTTIGALPALMMFTAAEAEYADPTATHPNPSCRILDALIYTLDGLAGNESTVHLFDNDQGMLPGAPQYQRLDSQRVEACS